MAEETYEIDEYQLLNCVASGNHTQVWEVLEKGGGKPMAMKLLLPEAFQDVEQKQILKHEAKVAQALKHPSLVEFHKAVFNKENGYILMEYFRAPNLKNQISSDLVSVQVRLTKIIESVCMALGYMHEQGWVHKDIKPDNILVNKSSELRLIDYSLATRASSSLSRMIGGKVKTIQGTRTYIAPETILRQRPMPQTDVYSLGITLFEILAGEPPFKGASPTDLLKKHVGALPPEPSSYNKNITPEMDKFVLRMLSKKPANRHKDMSEALAEFRSIKAFKEDVQKLADAETDRRKEQERASLAQASKLDSRADALRSEIQKETGEAPPPKKPAQPQPAQKQSQPPEQKPQQQPQQPAAAGQQPQPAYQQPPMPPQYGQPQYGQPYYPGYPQHPQPYPQMPGQQPMYGQPHPGSPYPQQGWPQGGAPGQPQQPPPQWGQPYPGGQPQWQQPPQQQPPQQQPAPQQPPPQQQPAPQQPAQQQPAQQQPGQQQPGQQQPGQQQPTQQPSQPPRQGAPQQQPPPPKPPAQQQPPNQQGKDKDKDDDLPLMEDLPPVV